MEDSGCGPVRLGDGFGSCILGGCFSKAHHQQSVLGTGRGQGVCVAGGGGNEGRGREEDGRLVLWHEGGCCLESPHPQVTEPPLLSRSW